MGKVAVGRTLSETLSFVFGRYPSLLGAAWIPLLVICVVYYFAILPLAREVFALARQGALHPSASGMPPDFGASMRFFPLANLAALIVPAWMNIAVTKAALGLPRRFPAAYVEFGNDEFRMIAANLIVMALVYAAVLAVVIVGAIVVAIGAALVSGGAIHSANGGGSYALLIGLAVIAGVAVLCAFIYLAVRVTFFLAPVTVMEKKVAVARSWELSRGNFWRIFAIIIALIFLILGLEIALCLVIVVPSIFAVAHAGSHDPVVALKTLLPFLPLLLLFAVLILPLFFGLQMAPAAFAYRALMESRKPMDTAV